MTTAAPTRVTSIELAADTLTPVAAALRLGPRCAFLLESVEGGARYGRYSIAGVKGRTLVMQGRDDPLEVLRAALPEVEPMAGDPAFPLASGVGYLAYEAAARWERLPVPEADPLGLPRRRLPPAVVGHRVRPPGADRDARDARRHRRATTAWPTSLRTLQTPAAGEAAGDLRRGPSCLRKSTRQRAPGTRPASRSLVEDIHAGEMLQAVLARRFSVP